MSLPLPLYIGRRYASLQSRGFLVGFISTLSVLGLAVGVAILITVLSVMNGFDRELRERILGMVPHLTLTSPRNQSLLTVDEWELLQAIIDSRDGVRRSAPLVSLQGMLIANGSSKGVALNGIDPQREQEVSILQEFIRQGDMQSLQAGSFNILVGEALARQLQLGIGDTVTLASTQVPITPMGEFVRRKNFTVSGIFRVGSQLDANLAMVHMGDAQLLYRLGNQVHGVKVQVENLFAVDQVARDLGNALPESFVMRDWTTDFGAIYENIRLSKTLVGLLLFLLVAVAAFNVVVSLMMVVKNKAGDIAILRAMGTSHATIRNIFLVQGFIIGLIGTMAGLVLGLLLSFTISDMVAWVERVFQVEFLSADIYPVNYLPSQVLSADLLLVCSAALLLSLLATLYPAQAASRVRPAEALRYE